MFLVGMPWRLQVLPGFHGLFFTSHSFIPWIRHRHEVIKTATFFTERSWILRIHEDFCEMKKQSTKKSTTKNSTPLPQPRDSTVREMKLISPTETPKPAPTAAVSTAPTGLQWMVREGSRNHFGCESRQPWLFGIPIWKDFFSVLIWGINRFNNWWIAKNRNNWWISWKYSPKINVGKHHGSTC